LLGRLGVTLWKEVLDREFSPPLSPAEISLAPRIHNLRNRQEKLQARRVHIESFLFDRRVELSSPKIVKSYVDDLRNLLNRSSLAERRAFIRSFVKEVKVTGDEVLLTYTMPLSPRGVSEEKVGVLSTMVKQLFRMEA